MAKHKTPTIEIIVRQVFLRSVFFLLLTQLTPHPAYSLDNARISSWHGFKRYHFSFENYSCFLTAPNNPLPSHPWVWRAKFPGYHTEVDLILAAQSNSDFLQ